MNKLLSIEEEKKFLIDFFHSEFCQYKVEKTDEFGDKLSYRLVLVTIEMKMVK